MLKLFLLLGSLFLSNRIDYQEIIQQDESGLEILEEVGNYRLYKQQGKIYLSACHQSWIVEAGSCEAYYVLLKGSSLIYLYQHQGYWFIKEYDLNGNLKAEKQILDNQFELSAALYQDYLYLAGSINKYQNPGLQDLRDQKKLQGRDGILLCLDENYDLVDFKVYGGGLDEAFLAMTASEQYLYLAGSKDPLTGGDFGNGGRIDDCLFICKVDFDLNLIEYYVLSVPGSILEFCFYEDYLYLATNHNLYKFSSALETVQKKTYSDTYKFGCLAAFNRLLLFSETTINCINIFNFTATEFASPFLEEATIKAFERCLYLIKPDGRYYYDLACLENFIVLEYYYPEIETEKKVMTLFGTAEFMEETTVFNPSLHGLYERCFQFRSPNNQVFFVIREQEVPMRVNVSEKMVYPLGYELQFTGQALLNGQTIYNHYPLTKTGFQTLELFDVHNQKTTINFEVTKEQIRFQENPVRFWDLTAQPGQILPLYFQIDAPGALDYAVININAEEQVLTIDNQTLSLELKAPDIPGIYYYYLRDLNYSWDDCIYNLPIHRVYTVNVLRTIPEFEVVQEKALSFRVTFNDPDRTARYFELTLTDNKTENSFHYRFDDCNFYLEDIIKEQEYRWSLNLLYDLGDGYLRKAELFHGTANGQTNFGELNIIQKGESLDAFRVSFHKLTNLYSQADLLYETEPTFLLSDIIFGFGGCVLTGFCTMQIIRFFKKKKLRAS